MIVRNVRIQNTLYLMIVEMVEALGLDLKGYLSNIPSRELSDEELGRLLELQTESVRDCFHFCVNSKI